MDNLETSFVETENSQNNLEDSPFTLDQPKVETKYETSNMKVQYRIRIPYTQKSTKARRQASPNR
nr:unnamed protein product [Callosobruchus chinensis]